MGEQEQKPKEARIARLKRRLERAKAYGANEDLCAVVAGLLDLLADEL